MRQRARPARGSARLFMCNHSQYAWELLGPLHLAGIQIKGVGFCSNFYTGECSGGVCIHGQG